MDPIALLVFAVFLVMLFAASRWWWVRKRSKYSQLQASDLRLDVASLGDRDPPQDGPQLSIYNTPVWLAALVIAPSGRDRALPTEQTVPPITDYTIPGLQEIILQHRTRIVVWPAQLSSRGFTQQFFREVPLPGNKGKGTSWCSVAGSIDFHGVGYQLGLVCRTRRPNNLGQYTVEQGKNWLDIARTSGAGA